MTDIIDAPVKAGSAATGRAAQPTASAPAPKPYTGKERRGRGAARKTMMIAGTMAAAAAGIAAASATVAAHYIGQHEAENLAADTASAIAADLMGPRISSGVINGDKAELAELDEIVRQRLSDGSILGIAVQDKSGRVIYSDSPSQIGQTLTIDRDALEIFDGAPPVAKLVTTTDAIDPNDSRFGAYEAFSVIDTADGRPALVEVHLAADDLQARADDVTGMVGPLAYASIALLTLMFLPLIWWIARKLEKSVLEQRRLLRNAVDAAASERARVARDLHDDIIPDLAGVGYSLTAIPSLMPSTTPGPVLDIMRQSSEVLKSDIAQLRGMLVELTPSAIASGDLTGWLSTLARTVPLPGASIETDIEANLSVSQRTAETIHRVTRESLRNIGKHAKATHVLVSAHGDGETIHVTIEDNGVGFNTDKPKANGHLGLNIVRDSVRDVGGVMDITSEPGVGTVVSFILRKDA